MDVDARRKVTSKVSYNGQLDPSTSTRYNARAPSPTKRAMSPSPRPMLKVKAKVNSTATPNSLVRKPSKLAPASSLTPRSGSPAPPRPSPRYAHTPPPQPKSRSVVTARSTVRIPPIQPSTSTPGTPVSMYNGLTTSSGLSRRPSLDSPVNVSPHRRTSSVSVLHHSPALESDLGPKIKSTITKLAKHGESLTPSPPHRLPNGTGRVRAPSMSSSNLSLSSANTSSTPEYNFYPITTGAPAANPHRFGSGRAHAPAPAHHSYQPFSRDDAPITYKLSAKVDPATIPLPAHSPPTSAVSYSSRSSVSRSSLHDSGDSLNGSGLRNALDNIVQLSTTEDDDFSDDDSGHDRGTDVEDMTRKVRLEAKTNRKIEDLEITNRSLLAINSTLEATKHRQAKEIRDLKRKLRESRLILPPRAFRAVKSSMENKDDTDDEDEEEEEADEEGDEVSMTKGDESYKRVKALLDGLVQTGKHALETKPADFVENAKGKVLSAEEVAFWEGPEDSIRLDEPPSMSADLDSEDEVEAMTTMLDLDAETASGPPSPAGPPILVTHSP